MLFILMWISPFFIYPPLKNRFWYFLFFLFFFSIFLHLWKDPEPRVWILFVFSIKGHKLTHDPPACVVLWSVKMLFILFGVKKKASLSIICHFCDLRETTRVWEEIIPSQYRYSLQKLLSSTPCCCQRLGFTFFFLLMRCFPFSANVKPIDAIRVQRRTHVSNFFNEEKRNCIFFFLSHIPCCSSSNT